MLNSRTECFLLRCQYVLRAISLEVKALQNRTVFVISTLFFMRTWLYFYERGSNFKKGWEPMFYLFLQPQLLLNQDVRMKISRY